MQTVQPHRSRRPAGCQLEPTNWESSRRISRSTYHDMPVSVRDRLRWPQRNVLYPKANSLHGVCICSDRRHQRSCRFISVRTCVALSVATLSRIIDRVWMTVRIQRSLLCEKNHHCDSSKPVGGLVFCIDYDLTTRCRKRRNCWSRAREGLSLADNMQRVPMSLAGA